MRTLPETMQTGSIDSRAPLRGLVWTLIRTDFKTRYHGSLSGLFWALLKPLAMFGVLMAIFSLIFSSDPDYKLNLVLGLFVWDFFSEGTKSGLASLHAKGFLLTKAKFPSWILVVSSSSNAIIALSVFSVAMVAYLAMARTLSLTSVLLYLVYQTCFLFIMLGVSLASSVLFLRYRDLNQIWDLTLQAGFFVAPIIYPLGLLPESVHAPLYLWPPTPIIQFSRDVLIAGTIPSMRAHLLLFACTAVIFGAGALIYRWLSPRSAEYLG